MSEQTYLKILRGGIYLVFLTPFLVFKSLLFPFITSKTFYFRIIIEILLVVYLLFLYQYPANIPKKKAIIISLSVFCIILIVTSFIGIDFNLSFWSDVERMEGVFGFLHLAAFFLFLLAAFKTKEEWMRLLFLFLLSILFLGFYGLGQKLGIKNLLLTNEARISSRLGNPAYLGAIELFGIALALFFCIKVKNKLSKAIYLAIGFFNFAILIFSGTRGALLGLFCAIILSLILYIFLLKKKKIKAILLVISILLLLIPVLILKSNLKIKDSIYLYRFTHLSFKDATWNTRLISWQAGLKGLWERPLGIGLGNYAYFFDKYFPPNFYTFTASQTYFDHAHNTIVDIAVTTGILGIICYLAIWAIITYYLIENYRTKKIDLHEFIIFLGLLLAYFVQNIFVFDCLITYIAFFIVIGYIAFHNFYGTDDTKVYKKNNFSPILAFVLIFFSTYLIFDYNILPALAMKKAVLGQYQIVNNDLAGGAGSFQEALSKNTVLDRDIRSSFINVIIGNSYKFTKTEERDKLMEVIDFTVAQAEKNLKLNPLDTLMNLQAGEILGVKAKLTKREEDFKLAEDYFNKALASSPGRLQILFEIANNKLMMGQIEEATKILERARELNPNYSECYANLAQAYIYGKNEDKGFPMIIKAMSMGYNGMNDDQLQVLAQYFSNKKDYNSLLTIFQRLTSRNPDNASLKAKLAFIYAKLGRDDEARNMVKETVEMDQGFKEEGEKFLKMLERGELKDK